MYTHRRPQQPPACPRPPWLQKAPEGSCSPRPHCEKFKNKKLCPIYFEVPKFHFQNYYIKFAAIEA